MDTRSGEILNEMDVEKLKALGLGRYVKPMTVQPTMRQMARRPPKVGRNEPCPCGSGKKFKRCCLGKEKR